MEEGEEEMSESDMSQTGRGKPAMGRSKLIQDEASGSDENDYDADEEGEEEMEEGEEEMSESDDAPELIPIKKKGKAKKVIKVD